MQFWVPLTNINDDESYDQASGFILVSGVRI